MSPIRILPPSLRNKIAAGEVIERPASVVKELLENSIDAGASRVSIEVLRAGKRLIRISDDGSGMDRADALLAFERYATSKLQDEKDLLTMGTLGFRGEALSSIAAVSKVRLATGSGSGAGTCIHVDGGEVRETKDCPAAGTAIEVRDLFYNTPARFKFLRSDSTENYHVIDTVTREALSHPETGFVLLMDGGEVLNLPPAAGVKERVLQVFGAEVFRALAEGETSATGVRVSVFAAEAGLARNNRKGQFIFVNRRPVRDQTVASAVYRAYDGLIPRDKHPLFLLFLEIDPTRVDVNVHPAKREVRFADGQGLYVLVHDAVRSALGRDSAPGVPGNAAVQDIGRPPEWQPSAGDTVPVSAGQVSEAPGFYGLERACLYLGDTFVAYAEGGGLVVLDYHAAHERVNYERILGKSGLPSHGLLFPQPVKLAPGDYRIIIEHRALLGQLGLDVEDFGHETVIVRGLPEALRDANLFAVLSDLASVLHNRDSSRGDAPVFLEEGDPVERSRRRLAARLACHASIRGREVPDIRRVSALLEDLAAAKDPDHCPHGRPTRVVISMEQLKRMFRK